METCLRGFSNTFIPPANKVNVVNMEYIEGGELERTWKTTRRQRLKQQEDKIWDEFVKEQDIVKSVCKDDPYQFLQELPNASLKELMDVELKKLKIETTDLDNRASLEDQRRGGGDSPRRDDHTVTFAEIEENDSEIFHIYPDDKDDDVSGPEDEVLDESMDTPCTVREQERQRACADVDEVEAECDGNGGGNCNGNGGGNGDGNGAGNCDVDEEEGDEQRDRSVSPGQHSVRQSSSKSSDNVANVIESSIYCARVKELRLKINEEIIAIMTSLENLDIVNIDPNELRKMCKRSTEFCSRFQRIHMYQLQRQMYDIKRHNALTLPFAKHTQFQSQMVRITSLHQNMLQSFQVLHRSFEQCACARACAEALRALATMCRHAGTLCRAAAPPPDHALSAADKLYDDDLIATCDQLEETVKEYVARTAKYVSPTDSASAKYSKKSMPKTKRKVVGAWAKSDQKNVAETGTKLSMYSLDTLRMPKRSRGGLDSNGTSKMLGGLTSRSKRSNKRDLTPKPRKSPRNRRPLMRDPHAGKERKPTERDQEVRTMVESVAGDAVTILICIGPWSSYFLGGISIGSTTVMLAQLRREAKSDEAISIDMGSWITASHSLAALVWVLVWSNLAQIIGRRKTFAISGVFVSISFLVFYFSTTTTEILIGEVIRGALFGTNLSTTLTVITEYTSPRYRGLCLTIKSASVCWGIWCSNALGTFFYWKYIGLFALICNLNLLTLFFWPESPLWLASQGRFQECATIHRWLKGTDTATEMELQKLINAQKEYLEQRKSKSTLKQRITEFIKTFARKEFYKPLLISQILLNLVQVSGKYVCSYYAIEIMKKVTKDEGKAYTMMLVLDGVTVGGMYFGCILSKFVARRALLMWCSILAIIFLYILVIYFYITSIGLLFEDGIVSLVLLATSSFFISIGPLILSTSIYGELIPSQNKAMFIIVNVLLYFSMQSVVLKAAPYLFVNSSLYVTFFVFAVLSSIDVCLLYKYLPETKDKTMQEIEEHFKDSSKTEEKLDHVEERRWNAPSS